VIPFLDVLFIRKEMTLATKVCRKPTHTGWYLNFKSNHSPHVKWDLIQKLHNTASTLCQEQDLFNGISSLRRDLQLNGCPKSFNELVINSKGVSLPNKLENPLGSVYIPYVKGVSEKLKRIGNWYNIRMIFKTNTLLAVTPENQATRDQQQTAQRIYNIPWKCGRSNIGETGIFLAVWVCEHRHNL
jgi:hypothetical protein